MGEGRPCVWENNVVGFVAFCLVGDLSAGKNILRVFVGIFWEGFLVLSIGCLDLLVGEIAPFIWMSY